LSIDGFFTQLFDALSIHSHKRFSCLPADLRKSTRMFFNSRRVVWISGLLFLFSRCCSRAVPPRGR
jgi:hypothetical protein